MKSTSEVLKVARDMVVKEDTTIKAFCQRYIERSNYDIGSSISEETEKNLKAIDDNIRMTMMNAHKFYVD